jgi:alkaline phosphatase
MSFSRRSLIGAGIAGLAATSLALPTWNAPRGKRPRNVIFCVSDGMALQTMAIADHLLQATEGRRSYWSELLDREHVVNGLQDTRSLSSVVTDSAAAASSWGCGRRIWNGQLNMYPDGTELRTLTQLLHEQGVRTGLVTTTTVTHATPAGFCVNAPNRNLEPLIAERYLPSGVHVLMGGGNRFFAPNRRADRRDLYAEFAAAGYHVVRDRAALDAAPNGRMLGIFSEGHLPYTVDRRHDSALDGAVPTLEQMSRKAIAALRGAPNGFLLQIEGGRVDHGAHGTDLAAMVYDQIEFEDAVRAAVEFALDDGETLVIVTSDHACGGPSLNGAGWNYDDSNDGLAAIARMRSSYGPLLADIGTSPTADRVRDAVRERLGVELTAAEAEAVVLSLGRKGPFELSIFHGNPSTTLAMVLGNHSKVTWTSGNHTNEHVLVTAVGPGADLCRGLTPNHRFFDKILACYGLQFENPTMDLETARRHMEKNRPVAPGAAAMHEGEIANLLLGAV